MPTLIENKKAGWNYELLETIEAGIELAGHEVKAVRAGHGSLAGAYVTIRGGIGLSPQAYLRGATISPYQVGNTPKEYEPARDRRLLLSRRELDRLAGASARQGLTLMPLQLYSKGRHLKLSLALARGKKKHDKRETLKRREAEREMARTLTRG